MVIQRCYSSDDVDAVVAQVIAQMSANLAEETRVIRDVLEQEITELRGDPQLVELLGASVESNVDTAFHVMRHGISTAGLQPPSAAIEYARRLAQHRIPMTALVRAYRLGQTVLQDHVFTTIQHSAIHPELGLEASRRIVAIASDYIDTVTERVVSAYQTEHDRWISNRNSIRSARISELLSTSDQVDEAETSAVIGYNLKLTHCAAILWSTPAVDQQRDELPRIETALRALAVELGARSEILFVPADRLTAWAWLSCPAGVQLDLAAARRFIGSQAPDIHVALGTPHPGSGGFKESHMEAREARTIAGLSAAPRGLISYADPGLAATALVSVDLNRARTWVDRVLGPLAADSDNASRLRDTLRCYLRNQLSHKATADEMHLHYNTVKYRVKNAERERGKPITVDRLDLELALQVDYWISKR